MMPKTTEPNLALRDWEYLRSLEMPEPEYIIAGLVRGEVGMLQAVTNVGKTTLCLNLSISLATGRPFEPFVGESAPKRVLYIDYETPLITLRNDILTMSEVLTEEQLELLGKNLVIYASLSPDMDDLDFSRPDHRALLVKRVIELKADLIIIDPITMAFPGINEQDNQSVIQSLFGPLRDVAKKTKGASLLFTHHIGKEKSEEGAGGKRNEAYRSRGASAFGTMSRIILQLDQKVSNGFEEVELSWVKTKTGVKPSPTIINLDREMRWFSPSNGEAPREENRVEDLVELIWQMGGEAKRTDLKTALGDSISTSTLDRCLRTGVDVGLLVRIGPGAYQLSDRAREEFLANEGKQRT